MVKTTMSTDGSENEMDSLASTRDKLKIQQRLIDISARNLQSTRLSSRDFSPGSHSSSGEVQSTIEENITVIENKIVKGFSRQLYLKHQHLKRAGSTTSTSSDEEGVPVYSLEVMEAGKHLDQWIDVELFLTVAGLEPRSMKALLSEDPSLDSLFMMSYQELDQLLLKLEVPTDDNRKLTDYLNRLGSYYEKWERGENPSTSAYDRLSSTSSRLSSISTLGSLDHDPRSDSVSSYGGITSSVFSPSPLAQNSSTPNASFAILTPTTSQPLLSPLPPSTGSGQGAMSSHQAVGMSHSSIGGIPSFNTTPGYSSGQMTSLNRSYSSSSSVLLADSEESSYSKTPSRYNRKYSHKRSHSNPLANLIMPESAHQSGGGGSGWSWRGRHRSPSPPSQPPVRSDSQPSMVSHSTSPSAVHKSKGHPQMRRVMGLAPSFSQSISNDQLMPTSTSPVPESPVFRQVTMEPVPRCNSLASGEPRRSLSSQPKMTSTSMVDLPITMATSSEHLDRISEYGTPLPQSGKSQSVPRLTLLTVSTESDKGGQSTSVPTSPRTPGTYTPTGHIGHAIGHRFTTKTFTPFPPSVCDYCKRTLMFGVKCKFCKYKCHKTCAVKAPPSCGLPQGLIDFYRKQVLLNSQSPSVDQVSPVDPHSPRPKLEKSNTYDSDTRDQFVIQDLTKEPKNGNFSPVMSQKKIAVQPDGQNYSENENGRTRPQQPRLLNTQTSAATLEVPHAHLPGAYRSTSSSPSTTPPTSPSLTPSSPRSPNDAYAYTAYPYSTASVPVIYTDDSADEVDSYDGEAANRIDDVSRSPSPFSSKNSSSNDISDHSRLMMTRGLRPPPQVILAKSLPDLLVAQSEGQKSADTDSGGSSSPGGVNGYHASYDNLLQHHSLIRKDSLQRTLSTTDSKTSTLVNSIPTEAEDDLDSEPGDVGDYVPTPSARVRHRNSVIDEWNIPYDDIKILERVGRGPVGEVYRGRWHGEVAIKRFCLPNATAEQISRFKDEVSILKKTRHENLALFMGASLTPPNLAIVTSFCKGPTLYKTIHVWPEVFSVDRSMNIAKQIAQAMGYLHARGIVHKDLNTKNIFLEKDKDKVVITDTGLSSLSDSIWIQQPGDTAGPHCEVRYGIISRTRLYYLAPEIMQVLSPCPAVQENGDLYPYSDKTDVYAFGTVLYEVLTRKFPFSTDSLGVPFDTSAIIFQVGRGNRQEITAREVPKRVKDLIWDCWHPNPQRRLPFSTIWEVLTKLSRKKTPIARSPSFPISLSRSTESLRVN